MALLKVQGKFLRKKVHRLKIRNLQGTICQNTLYHKTDLFFFQKYAYAFFLDHLNSCGFETNFL